MHKVFYLTMELQVPQANRKDVTSSEPDAHFGTTWNLPYFRGPIGRLVTASGTSPVTYSSFIGLYIMPELDKALRHPVFQLRVFSASVIRHHVSRGPWPHFPCPKRPCETTSRYEPWRPNDWLYQLDILQVDQTQGVLPSYGVTSPWGQR